MKQHLQRWIKRAGKSLLWGLSACLILLVVVFLSVQAGLVWLSSSGGQSWLQAQLDQAMPDSPYQISFERFSLAGLTSVSLGDITVYQNDQGIASIHDAILTIDAYTFFFKSLGLHLSIDTLNIIQLPSSTEQEKVEKKSALALSIPDLFIHTIHAQIDIHALSLSKDIVQDGFQGSLSLEQDLHLSNQIATLSGSLDIVEAGEPTYKTIFPLHLSNMLHIDTAQNSISLDTFDVIHERDSFRTTGQYNLGTQNFQIASKLNWAFPQEVSDDFSAPLTGTLSLLGHPENYDGTVKIESALHDLPLEFRTQLQGNITQNSHIQIEGHIGGALQIDGDVNFNHTQSQPSGHIVANISNLSALAPFTRQNDLSGQTEATLNIRPEQAGMITQIKLSGKNIQRQDFRLERMTGTIISQDFTFQKANFTLENVQQNETLLKKTNIIATEEAGQYLIKLRGDGFNLNPFQLSSDLIVKNISPLDVMIKDASMQTKTGKINAKGTLQPEKLDVTVTGRTLSAQELPFISAAQVPLIIQEMDAVLTGSMTAPHLTLNGEMRSTRPEYKNLSLRTRLSLDSEGVNGQVHLTNNQKKQIDGTLHFPFQLSLEPFQMSLNDQTPLTGNFSGRLALHDLAALFLPDTYVLSGDLDVQTNLGGTMSNPALQGNLQLKSGYFKDNVNQIAFKHVQGNISLDNRQLTLNSLQAKSADDQGSLTAKGVLNLADIVHPQAEASIKLDNFLLIQNVQTTARMSADLNFANKSSDYLLSGQITPNELKIQLPERFDTTIPTLNTITMQDQNSAPSTGPDILLDIDFTAKNQIFVRGWGLDAELAGKLDITGTVDNPLVNGQLETLRGRYEELGKRFNIDYARLLFQGAIPPSPYLDVKTSTDLDEITAHILISGRATQPALTFNSTPALPQDEVLSRILFGKDMTEISPFQAVELARTIQRFSGKGSTGPDIMGTIRDVTGLDDIRVDGLGTEDARVGAGKYLTDKVYLQVEQGAGEASGAVSVEVEVTPHVKVESSTGQNGESDVGVFWEWAY